LPELNGYGLSFVVPEAYRATNEERLLGSEMDKNWTQALGSIPKWEVCTAKNERRKEES